MVPTAADKSLRWISVLVGLFLAANVAGWLALGILPDEAYYWVWSQRLQAGYYDHAPLIAWLIRPFTEVFGNNAFAIRLPGALGWGVGAALAFDGARRLYGSRRAGTLAVLVWSSLPIIQVGFHITTPDTPLVLFAWVTFYFALRAVLDPQPRWWWWAGLGAGLTMLSKYSGLLVPVAILAGLALDRDGRRMLARREPWLAAVLAAVVVMPMVWWNWRHDWISFAFQFQHGVKQQLSAPLTMFGAFLGGQLAAVMPWTWVAMAIAALPRRSRPEPGAAFSLLAVGFWLPLVVFGLAGLTGTSHPNWPVTAYVPGTLLLAGLLDRWLRPERRGRMIAVIALALTSLVLVNLIRFPHWWSLLGVQLPPQRTQLAQAYGWDEVKQRLDGLRAGRDCVVVGDRLQTTAMLALLHDDVDRVVVASDTRINQFHLWQAEAPVVRQRLCVYVAQEESPSRLPLEVDLHEMGRWQRIELLALNNPDLSQRWTGFYLPMSH